MRSLIAALRTLVLPFGTTSGTRIVLDGVNGEILIYDAADALVAKISDDGFETFAGGPSATLRAAQLVLGSGNGAETIPALLSAGSVGVGGAVRTELEISGPDVGVNHPVIRLWSDSVDGTTVPLPVIQFANGGDAPQPPADVRFGGSGGTGGTSIGRGPLQGGYFSSGTDDSSRAAGVDTKITKSGLSIYANRLYRISAHAQVNSDGAAGNHYCALEHDGTVIGILHVQPASEVRYMNGFIDYEPASDDSSATFTVSNHSASAGNIQLIAQSDNRMTMLVEDIGRVDPP